MYAEFRAEKLASGLGGLPEEFGSTSYRIVSKGTRGFVATPEGSPELIVKVFAEPYGEGMSSYEFDTLNYARNTSAKPLKSLPLAYALGHLSNGSRPMPAIALKATAGETMREMGYGRLARSGVPRRRSTEELFGFALSLADTLLALRSHYIHLRVRTPDTVIVRNSDDVSMPEITLSDIMSGGFSSPAGQCLGKPAMDPLPFTPPELMRPVEDTILTQADGVDVWVYGSLVCFAAVGRFWDDWMDSRNEDELSTDELATARSLKRSALDLRTLAPDYFTVPDAFPQAESVADVVMACTNAEPLLRPDIASIKSSLEVAKGVETPSWTPMPFR